MGLGALTWCAGQSGKATEVILFWHEHYLLRFKSAYFNILYLSQIFPNTLLCLHRHTAEAFGSLLLWVCKSTLLIMAMQYAPFILLISSGFK